MFLSRLLVPLARLFSQTHSTQLRFELRHLHATTSDARLVFSDIPRTNPKWLSADDAASSSYTIRHTAPVTTYKPPSFDAYVHSRKTNWDPSTQSAGLNWNEQVVLGPDVQSRETLLLLAKMTNDAYLNPGEAGWYQLGKNWTVPYPFGWQPPYDDGFRGQVFATPDNSTVVVSIKGTSAGLFGGGGSTAQKDKLNDNLLFSCCCANIDWTWTTVCDCSRGGYKCDEDCVEEALIEESLFYPIGTNLYNNLTYMYPDSTIWVIGHSLGGALASLIGITFGAPAVTFESPGEKMAARRLHLPSPPSLHHVTHVFHTADPIAMGTCNGVLSSCSLGGYAMESKCHLGKTIVYDTVSNLSWSVDVRKHGIVKVIEEILGKPWLPSVNAGREVPEAVPQDDCVECYQWDFGSFPPQKKGWWHRLEEDNAQNQVSEDFVRLHP